MRECGDAWADNWLWRAAKWGEMRSMSVVLRVVEDWMGDEARLRKRTKRPGKGKASRIPEKRGGHIKIGLFT